MFRTVPPLMVTICRTISISLLVFAPCYLPLTASAATINAASVAYQDVYNAVQAARDGDTVIVPAGTASWTQTLYITQRIQLIGATTIMGDHNSVGSGGLSTMAANDQTIIVDSVPQPSGSSNQVAKLIQATIAPGSGAPGTAPLFRISGITFQLDTNQTWLPSATSAAITLLTPATTIAASDNIRIDHCHWNQLRQKALIVNGWLYPLIDHCIYDSSLQGPPNGTGGFKPANVLFASVSHPTWGSTATQKQEIGNGSYAEASHWGGSQFAFFEDDTVNNSDTNSNAVITNAATDADNGARYVFRYCIFRNTWVGQHGTESGAYRGGRAMEMYTSTVTFTNVNLSGILRRSGTGLVWGNTVNAVYHNPHMMSLTCYLNTLGL
jgi:hypothetical protein